jgi:hypothetical protein
MNIEEVKQRLIKEGKLPAKDLSSVHNKTDLSTLLRNGESCICTADYVDTKEHPGAFRNDTDDIYPYGYFGIAKRVAKPDTFFELFKKGEEKSHQRIGLSSTGSWSRLYDLNRDGLVERKIADPHYIEFKMLKVRL